MSPFPNTAPMVLEAGQEPSPATILQAASVKEGMGRRGRGTLKQIVSEMSFSLRA
jgi:hypothetical protein